MSLYYLLIEGTCVKAFEESTDVVALGYCFHLVLSEQLNPRFILMKKLNLSEERVVVYESEG